MKKFVAILLSIICLFSALACPGFAMGDLFGDILEDQFGMTEEEGSIDQVLNYGITYEMRTLETVSIMYMPNATRTFKSPVVAKVTMDTPLSVDYQLVCWKEKETGAYYYPGDEIEVNGQVVLYAIWEEKTDNHPRFIRVITTAFEALGRLIDKFLGVYDAFEEVEKEFGTTAPATTEPATTAPATTAAA